MAMDRIFVTLACYLLALSLSVAHTEKGNMATAPTIANSDSNLTHMTTAVTPSNSTVHVTVSNSTENTTPLTSMTQDKETVTTATTAITESSSHPQASQSTVITPPANSTSLTTTTPGIHTPVSTEPTTQANQTTEGSKNTSDTTVITTANSPQTVNVTSGSLDSSSQGLQLNTSEKNMTILFSVILGVFAMILVTLMFHKCKQKIQYMHQPLNNTDDTDAFVAEDDTLVISGGLYDGHPIYDNVPMASTNQSQNRLEFLH